MNTMNEEIQKSAFEATFIIEEELGSGSGGTVYKAFHKHLEKYVVIKKMHESVEKVLDKRTETDALKHLRHPYIPQVLDLIELEDGVYTVMDYIPGKTFGRLLREGRRFKQKEVIKYAKQLFEVLAYIHGENNRIIHGDIKPDNLILTPDDNICLIDFNIAGRAGREGTVIEGYTAGYASPEQINEFERFKAKRLHAENKGTPKEPHDDAASLFVKDIKSEDEPYETTVLLFDGIHTVISSAVDERSDIYSAAATIYHILTNEKPRRGGFNIVEPKAVRKDTTGGFNFILSKCLEYEPEKRFQSASAVLEAIDNAHKFDERYKSLVKKQITEVIISALLLLAGILILIKGLSLSGHSEGSDPPGGSPIPTVTPIPSGTPEPTQRLDSLEQPEASETPEEMLKTFLNDTLIAQYGMIEDSDLVAEYIRRERNDSWEVFADNFHGEQGILTWLFEDLDNDGVEKELLILRRESNMVELNQGYRLEDVVWSVIFDAYAYIDDDIRQIGSGELFQVGYEGEWRDSIYTNEAQIMSRIFLKEASSGVKLCSSSYFDDNREGTTTQLKVFGYKEGEFKELSDCEFSAYWDFEPDIQDDDGFVPAARNAGLDYTADKWERFLVEPEGYVGIYNIVSWNEPHCKDLICMTAGPVMSFEEYTDLMFDRSRTDISEYKLVIKTSNIIGGDGIPYHDFEYKSFESIPYETADPVKVDSRDIEPLDKNMFAIETSFLYPSPYDNASYSMSIRNGDMIHVDGIYLNSWYVTRVGGDVFYLRADSLSDEQPKLLELGDYYGATAEMMRGKDGFHEEVISEGEGIFIYDTTGGYGGELAEIRYKNNIITSIKVVGSGQEKPCIYGVYYGMDGKEAVDLLYQKGFFLEIEPNGFTNAVNSDDSIFAHWFSDGSVGSIQIKKAGQN